MLTFFDLFSGIGGFRLALEYAGFKCIGSCEIDKHASRLYKACYGTNNEVFYSDATTIDTSTMPDFDILTAGFPCQSFSIAGTRQGFDDKRGNLFFEIIRILKDKRPRYFILENVKNLLSIDNGKTFQTILKSLADLGYIVQWQLINSKFYLPQNRERVFIVGHLGAKCFRQIFYPAGYDRENNGADKKTLVYWRNGKDKWVEENKTYVPALKTQSDYCRQTLLKVGSYRPCRKDGKIFREIKNGISPAIVARAREDGDAMPMIAIPVLTPGRLKKRQNGRRFKTNNEPMFTLTAQDRHGIFDGYRLRRLTPLECFRLQGFPDDIVQKAYEIGISDAQLYKMAGNAVTIPVVCDIAAKLKQ